jgi:ABC-2 type transport system ATP-binding protein
MDHVLIAKGLSKTYGAKKALDDVSLELPKGQIIGLLGPNGSGKTTFLKLCAGLLTPNSGSVEICGKPIGPDTKAIVSYLPDRTYLNNRQKVSQQLGLFEDFYADFDRERAEQMLAALNISTDVRFGTLSKGSREKVMLVLVMARRAKLYLLDEPIGGVDPAARDYILNTIVTNFDPDATVIISTHLIADVEPVLDGFIFLHEGKVLRTGYTENVRQESGKTLDELFREVFKCLPNC